MPKQPERGRVLPPRYKLIMDIDRFRKFSFMERLKIFLGYNIVYRCAISTEHSPGKFDAVATVELTKEIDPLKV